MSLNTTHANWLTGSYAADLQFLLKVAENNDLRLGTSTDGLHPTRDIVANPDSLVIGYGYDLVKNKSIAYSDLLCSSSDLI